VLDRLDEAELPQQHQVLGDARRDEPGEVCGKLSHAQRPLLGQQVQQGAARGVGRGTKEVRGAVAGVGRRIRRTGQLQQT
jgi:hypothetical protein